MTIIENLKEKHCKDCSAEQEEHICIDCIYYAAIQALEKQIPKKVFNKSIGHDEHAKRYYGECPLCLDNMTAYEFQTQTHCWRCGQKLDWSENNG